MALIVTVNIFDDSSHVLVDTVKRKKNNEFECAIQKRWFFLLHNKFLKTADSPEIYSRIKLDYDSHYFLAICSFQGVNNPHRLNIYLFQFHSPI